MRIIATSIGLLMALATPAAAGEFDTRCTRMTVHVAQLPGLTDGERQTMTTAIKEYCVARERCLGEVKRMFQVPLTTKTLTAVPGCITSPPLDLLDRGIKTVAETSMFKAAELGTTLSAEEAGFFRALNTALFAVALNRDSVAERKGLVDAMAVDMRDKKWPEVLRYGDQFCRQLQGIQGANWVAPVTQTTADAVDKAAETVATVVKLFLAYNGAKDGASPKDLEIQDQWIDQFKNHVTVASRALAERTYRRERETAQQAMNGGRATMYIYRDLKRTAVDFLAANRGDVASLQGAMSAVDMFVSAARASGQDDDAKRLSDSVRAELASLRADYDKAFQAFNSEHENNVRNLRAKVTCQAEWKAVAGKIRGESTTSKLADTQRKVETYFGVPGEVRYLLERRIASQMGQLKDALSKEISDQLADIAVIEKGLDESDDE
jgi:hypothetical protein